MYEEFLDEECPCGSEKIFDKCCLPILSEEQFANSPEELMRSRYCAFVTGSIDFIVASHDPDKRDEVNKEEIQAWSEGSIWENLHILNSSIDESKSKGEVEFVAEYTIGRKAQRHHELSEFIKKEDRWYFYDGKLINTTVTRDSPKVGRNDPCPCGSGKKFKKCCG